MILNGYNEGLIESIKNWLREDVGAGDVTTSVTIPAGNQSKAIIHAKDNGVIAGMTVAELVFQVVDPDLVFTPKVTDGDKVTHGTILAEVEGSTHSLLTGNDWHLTCCNVCRE